MGAVRSLALAATRGEKLQGPRTKLQRNLETVKHQMELNQGGAETGRRVAGTKKGGLKSALFAGGKF